VEPVVDVNEPALAICSYLVYIPVLLYIVTVIVPNELHVETAKPQLNVVPTVERLPGDNLNICENMFQFSTQTSDSFCTSVPDSFQDLVFVHEHGLGLGTSINLEQWTQECEGNHSAVDFLTCNNTKMQQDQGVVYGVENLRLVLQVTYQAPWGLPESPRRVVIKGADQPGKEAVFTSKVNISLGTLLEMSGVSLDDVNPRACAQRGGALGSASAVDCADTSQPAVRRVSGITYRHTGLRLMLSVSWNVFQPISLSRGTDQYFQDDEDWSKEAVISVKLADMGPSAWVESGKRVSVLGPKNDPTLNGPWSQFNVRQYFGVDVVMASAGAVRRVTVQNATASILQVVALVLFSPIVVEFLGWLFSREYHRSKLDADTAWNIETDLHDLVKKFGVPMDPSTLKVGEGASYADELLHNNQSIQKLASGTEKMLTKLEDEYAVLRVKFHELELLQSHGQSDVKIGTGKQMKSLMVGDEWLIFDPKTNETQVHKTHNENSNEWDGHGLIHHLHELSEAQSGSMSVRRSLEHGLSNTSCCDHALP